MNEKSAILNHFNSNYKPFYQKYIQNIKNIGGDEYQALCPFPAHDDTNPSFNFNSATGQYYCQGCGKKGDIFHFHGKINGLDTRRHFPTAPSTIPASSTTISRNASGMSSSMCHRPDTASIYLFPADLGDAAR